MPTRRLRENINEGKNFTFSRTGKCLFGWIAVYGLAATLTLGSGYSLIGCGDDESYNPVGSYTIYYHYISGECPFDEISSGLKIDSDWQIIAEEMSIEFSESSFLFGAFIVGTIIDCDPEGCQFEISAAGEMEEPIVISFELTGSGNISSSGEIGGIFAIEISDWACVNEYLVAANKQGYGYGGNGGSQCDIDAYHAESEETCPSGYGCGCDLSDLVCQCTCMMQANSCNKILCNAYFCNWLGEEGSCTKGECSP